MDEVEKFGVDGGTGSFTGAAQGGQGQGRVDKGVRPGQGSSKGTVPVGAVRPGVSGFGGSSRDPFEKDMLEYLSEMIVEANERKRGATPVGAAEERERDFGGSSRERATFDLRQNGLRDGGHTRSLRQVVDMTSR